MILPTNDFNNVDVFWKEDTTLISFDEFIEFAEKPTTRDPKVGV